MVHFRVFSLAIFYLAIVVSVFVLLAFHRAPLILNALGWGSGVIHLVPSSSCGFVLVNIS